MADTLHVELNPTHIEVEPGAVPGDATVTIQNVGHVVEQYSIDVVGLDQDWFSTPVSSVGLFPQDSEQLRVSFHPPKRMGVRAGSYPFRVVVRARGSAEEATVEGVLDVRGFAIYRADLRPRRLTAGKRGTYQVQFTNTGTADIRLALEARDAEEGCTFRFPKETTHLVPAGNKSEVPLVVQPKRRPWIGGEKTYEFTVTARPQDGREDPQSVTGQFIHRPFLRSWAPIRRVVLLLLVVVVVLVLADVAVSTGVAGEFPRRVQVAGARAQALGCEVPVLRGLCPAQVIAARPDLAPEECVFEFGFKEFADAHGELLGECTSNAAYDGFGNGIQYTRNGVLYWIKDSNTIYFFVLDHLYSFVAGELRLLDAPGL